MGSKLSFRVRGPVSSLLGKRFMDCRQNERIFSPSISLDSVASDYDPAFAKSLGGKAAVWTWMPDSPTAINDKGSIYVVMGDPTYGGIHKPDQ